MFQLRVNFEKDAQRQEAMWERQHELAADKIFAMCSDLGGFFLKVFFDSSILVFCRLTIMCFGSVSLHATRILLCYEFHFVWFCFPAAADFSHSIVVIPLGLFCSSCIFLCDILLFL